MNKNDSIEKFKSFKPNFIFINGAIHHLDDKTVTNTNKFVEPFLPNEKIGIIHLAAGLWKNNKDMRLNKDIKIELKTLEGKKIEKSLRFGIK